MSTPRTGLSTVLGGWPLLDSFWTITPGSHLLCPLVYVSTPTFDVSLTLSLAQCAIFQKTLAGKTFFPQSTEYQAQEVSYYSSEQTDLKPSCRVSPTSAADVSFIIKTAAQKGCEFAVRSGGHMTWKGSSNVGPSGFTIDMEEMNTVSLSNDRSIASLGSGATWGQAYGVLDPMNLTVVGARTSGVGVGGYLLGGAIWVTSLKCSTFC